MSGSSPHGQGPVNQVVNHVWFVLLQRIATIVGIPLAGFLFNQIWGGIDSLKTTAVEIRMVVKEVQGDIKLLNRTDDDLGRRLRDLELGRRRTEFNNHEDRPRN